MTQEEKDYITKQALNGIACKEIAQDLQRNYTTIKRFLDKNNLPSNPKKYGIPYEYYESIFTLYKSGLTLKQIHEDYYPQFTVDQINYICKQEGITRRNGKQVSFNEHYFSVIDTEEKAYFLGLITADGHMSNVERDKSYMMSIALMKEDKYIIEKLAEAVETNLTVKEYENKTGFQRKDRRPHIECRLCLSSPVLYNDLEKYGITYLKSKRLSVLPDADIPKELMRHYIRGFFDGNGSVITTYSHKNTENKILKFVFYSTKAYCENLKHYLEDNVGVNQISVYTHKHEDCSFITYGSKKDSELLFHYMYDDATVFLKRKYEKAKNFLLNR